jgi:hypothetical protein
MDVCLQLFTDVKWVGFDPQPLRIFHTLDNVKKSQVITRALQ